jgi:hypothetical protein
MFCKKDIKTYAKIIVIRIGFSRFADLIGALSVRTSNFIFPSVCLGASVTLMEKMEI